MFVRSLLKRFSYATLFLLSIEVLFKYSTDFWWISVCDWINVFSRVIKHVKYVSVLTVILQQLQIYVFVSFYAFKLWSLLNQTNWISILQLMCLVERDIGFSSKYFYLINHLRMNEVCLKLFLKYENKLNPKLIQQFRTAIICTNYLEIKFIDKKYWTIYNSNKTDFIYQLILRLNNDF
jgi:hypothetical protein